MAPVDLGSLHRVPGWSRYDFPAQLGNHLDNEFTASLTELETALLGAMEYPGHLANHLVDMYGPEV